MQEAADISMRDRDAEFARKRDTLAKADKRIAELDRIISRLYEDNVMGKLSDDRFIKMSHDYELEQSNLKSMAEVLRKELKQQEQQKTNAKAFVAAVKKYTDMQELDAAVLREFIDRIEVSHADKKSKTREITIVYNFIGAFDFTRAIEEAHNTTQKQQKTAYSDCTVRITYSARLNPDKSLVCGDEGNSNDVVLVWKRTNSSFYDTLVDDCHVYSYGLDLTKEFSDGQGHFSKVEFLLYNDTDGYFVTAELNESEGIYYVTGHVSGRDDATRFTPTANGSVLVKGLEDDSYIATEIQTANGYTLLRDDIQIMIEAAESDVLCDIYGTDVLGVLQNDPRYADVPEGLYKNMPQKHLEHCLLTAFAKVDSNDVTMEADGESANAIVPLTVVNTRGFNLPQTGGRGTWMYGAAGTVLMVAAAIILVSARRKKLGK